MAMVLVVVMALFDVATVHWHGGHDDPSESWQGGGEGLHHPATSGTEDRETQRERAIKQRDPSLLPVCTEDEITDRRNPMPAKSMDPWEHKDQVGCLVPTPGPGDGVWGPASRSGVSYMTSQ